MLKRRKNLCFHVSGVSFLMDPPPSLAVTVALLKQKVGERDTMEE
jgi:hypothetical protein